MHPSPHFSLNPSVLGFVTTCRLSSASSNQSFVRDGVGYEELYPSSYRDLDELSERSPFAASPSSKNEDMELAEPEEGSDDGEQRIKSVVGTDGLREFVMLPE